MSEKQESRVYYHCHMTMTAGKKTKLSGDYAGVLLIGQLDGKPMSYGLSPGETARITFDAVEMPLWGEGRYGVSYTIAHLRDDGQIITRFEETRILGPDLIAAAQAADLPGRGYLVE